MVLEAILEMREEAFYLFFPIFISPLIFFLTLLLLSILGDHIDKLRYEKMRIDSHILRFKIRYLAQDFSFSVFLLSLMITPFLNQNSVMSTYIAFFLICGLPGVINLFFSIRKLNWKAIVSNGKVEIHKSSKQLETINLADAFHIEVHEAFCSRSFRHYKNHVVYFGESYALMRKILTVGSNRIQGCDLFESHLASVGIEVKQR